MSYGVIHGLLLKTIALAFKALFIFTIIDNFKNGVFAEYSVILSVGIILGQMLSLSCAETLAIKIAGSREKASKYLGIENHLLVICLMAIFVGFGLKNLYVYIIISIIYNMYFSYVSGCLRSLSPVFYEWMLNVPLIMFVLICEIFKIDTLDFLITANFAISLLVVHSVVLIAGFTGKGGYSFSHIAYRIFDSANSLNKTVSNIILLILMRSMIILPPIFLPFGDLDQLSKSFAIAESVVGLLMINVNRKFNKYCNNEASGKEALLFSIKVYLILLILAANVWILGQGLDAIGIDHKMLSNSLIFFGFILSLINIRNFVWAKKNKSKYVEITIISMLALFMMIMLYNKYINTLDWFYVFVIFSVLMNLLFLVFTRKKFG